MYSIVVRRFGGPEVVQLVDGPVPEPGDGQVRIMVAASSVNAIDLSARAGRLTQAGLMAAAEQIGLGWDVSGYVDAVGSGVRRFSPGDPVVGLRDLLFAPGAHAEQVVLDESAVARAPRSASPAESATLPLNGLTADRSLDMAGLHGGQTLLVTGAAGGVGGYVLELAAAHGIRTIALARPDDTRLVRKLGATDVVTSADNVGAAVRDIVRGGVDAVIDAACLGIQAHNALRGAGTFIALVAPFAPPPIRGTRVLVQEVFADGARLAELAAMVDAGALTLRVAAALPLADAATAHTMLERGGLRGRVVLQPSGQGS
jgi:NADPH:quinone reductase-like Zn-dependent oxidoreductase